MTKAEVQQLVLTSAVVATVSAVASGIVSYAIAKALARYEQANMSEREKELARREEALQNAYAQLPFPLSGPPRCW